MKELIGRITSILLLSVFSTAVFAVEPDDQEAAEQIPHAQNSGGLTGLIFTNSAYIDGEKSIPRVCHASDAH